MNISKLTILSTILTGFAFTQANAQDYTAYDELLKKYAHPTGVDYKAWDKNTKDHKALENILKEWAKIDASKLPHADKAAFRINLYNAAMVDTVLDNYPLTSVTKLGEKAFAIFDANIIKTPAGAISLNTLEKKTLLKDFPDSRVHFAVNCASVSCPPLRNEAYTGAKLQEQLTDQSVKFANSSHAVQVKGATALYSELFNWYASDFKTKNPATYLNNYRTNKLNTGSKIEWIKYDWNLNQSVSQPLNPPVHQSIQESK